eukprot:366028-Chlamydomonas_euryale.AAC.2
MSGEGGWAPWSSTIGRMATSRPFRLHLRVGHRHGIHSTVHLERWFLLQLACAALLQAVLLHSYCRGALGAPGACKAPADRAVCPAQHCSRRRQS